MFFQIISQFFRCHYNFVKILLIDKDKDNVGNNEIGLGNVKIKYYRELKILAPLTPSAHTLAEK